MPFWRTDRVALSKPFLLALLLVPAIWLGVLAIIGGLGPDPAKLLVDQLGLWALRILMLSLCLTPLRRITRQQFWGRYRRLVGLTALFYAVLHVLAYALFLFGSRWEALASELSRRPYVMVGALALLILLLMGLTSTRGWQRRLGRGWGRLHRFVYAALLLVLLHLVWVQKLGVEGVWPYFLGIAFLLGIRLWWKIRQSVAFPRFSR